MALSKSLAPPVSPKSFLSRRTRVLVMACGVEIVNVAISVGRKLWIVSRHTICSFEFNIDSNSRNFAFCACQFVGILIGSGLPFVGRRMQSRNSLLHLQGILA